MSRKVGRVEHVEGIAISNADRPFGASGVTKGDLARHYAFVAPLMLPHVRERPLSLVRCPDGVLERGFFQKHAMAGVDASVHAEIEPEGEEITWVRDARGLVALSQMSIVEIHGWGSRVDAIESPDWIVLDLDPDERLPWRTIVDGARWMRERVESLGLRAFVKTTGGKGLHVVVPLLRKQEWPVVAGLSQAIAVTAADSEPKRFTDAIAKRAREGRIFVDYLRNGRGATAILPYSARARPGLPVATPIDWSELDDVDPRAITVTTLPTWLDARKEDPWKDLASARRAIGARVLDRLADGPKRGEEG